MKHVDWRCDVCRIPLAKRAVDNGKRLCPTHEAEWRSLYRAVNKAVKMLDKRQGDCR